MKKIPTIFVRDKSNPKIVTNEPVPGVEWVFAGEGVATRKYDGTCCAVIDGRLYKRFQISSAKLKERGLPDGYIEAQHVEGSGEHFGWVPVGNGPEDWMHREAWKNAGESLPDGTYELLGPKVQRNPENVQDYVLQPHAEAVHYLDAPRTFEGLRDWLKEYDIEGLVWHHSDGRMAKIKLRDFGHKRAPAKALA